MAEQLEELQETSEVVLPVMQVDKELLLLRMEAEEFQQHEMFILLCKSTLGFTELCPGQKQPDLFFKMNLMAMEHF